MNGAMLDRAGLEAIGTTGRGTPATMSTRPGSRRRLARTPRRAHRGSGSSEVIVAIVRQRQMTQPRHATHPRTGLPVIDRGGIRHDRRARSAKKLARALTNGSYIDRNSVSLASAARSSRRPQSCRAEPRAEKLQSLRRQAVELRRRATVPEDERQIDGRVPRHRKGQLGLVGVHSDHLRHQHRGRVEDRRQGRYRGLIVVLRAVEAQDRVRQMALQQLRRPALHSARNGMTAGMLRRVPPGREFDGLGGDPARRRPAGRSSPRAGRTLGTARAGSR